MPGFFDKQSIVAKPDFNRWRVPVASVAIHLCIGSVYAWSIFNPALTRVHGVVGGGPDDWSLKQVVWVFTVAIVFLGLSASFAGRWLEKVGPRTVGIVAALCWGGGFVLASLGIQWHQLWLLYLGYGVIGGCGLGLGYVSPVSTLIRWFPDRRGMAAGMAIMGFGGGAIVGTPLKEFLIRFFYQAPQYLGQVANTSLTTEGGARFALVAGQLREVLIVGPNDVSQMLVPGPEGVYLLGTGRTGVAEAFLALGVLYLIVMILAACSYRIPAENWRPKGWNPSDNPRAAKKMISVRHVHIDEAVRTPQFYLLWIILCFNVTAGIGVLGVAKTYDVGDFWNDAAEDRGCGLRGHLCSDDQYFQHGGTFLLGEHFRLHRPQGDLHAVFCRGIVLYLSIPYTAHQVSVSPSSVWLVYFYAATMIIFTMYGGGFATIPAYLADLFGTRFVGGIHGKLLTAWSTAGVLGPLAITSLRESSLQQAIERLAGQVNPADFRAKFGAPLEALQTLVAQKTVTLPKLMEIAPAGTVNPASTLYNSTMILMAGLLVIALIANLLVRPVDSKHFMAE
jgi:MFS family permease